MSEITDNNLYESKSQKDREFYDNYGVWPVSDDSIDESETTLLSDADIEAHGRMTESIAARQYLDETDWYVARKFETGKAIPQEVLIERQKCREAIV